MSRSPSWIVRIGLPVVLIGGYVVIAGRTGFCPTCALVMDKITPGPARTVQVDSPQLDTESPDGEQPGAGEFRLTARPGGVDLAKEYDLRDPKIPLDEVHTLLPRDAIPSLTDPRTESVEDALTWLPREARIISVEVPTEDGGVEAVGVPLAILNFHEVANMTIAGERVAATYCPLCDSATVVSLVVEQTGPDGPVPLTLELGVSGALYNSNVLMYDKQTLSLFSQLGMMGVTGPLSGVMLDALPVRIVTLGDFAEAYPDAPVLSRDTGHERPYMRDPYAEYFGSDELKVSVRGIGKALAPKTLGMGVLCGDKAYFVPASIIGERYELTTPNGTLVLASGDAGVRVVEQPEGVRAAQTFYYSWSAFNPDLAVAEPLGTDVPTAGPQTSTQAP